MKISEEGLRLIKSFEGYHTRQKDGSCSAYLCPARVPTIGYGCTEGVKIGMVWTADEAEAALLREIARFENAVNASVTVEINQNEFDAMVSLAYNIGAAGFKKSTVLRRLNKGDRAGAAKGFQLWNKGGGRVLAGLVSRRMREAALFLKPATKPDEPFMPQTVTPAAEPPRPSAVAVAIGTATTVATQVIPQEALPTVPKVVTDSVTNVNAWKGFGDQIWTLKTYAQAQPVLALSVLVLCVALWLWPKRG